MKICNTNNITSFGIQNSWGDFNKSFSSEPDIYLVLDKKAKEITKKKIHSKKLKLLVPLKMKVIQIKNSQKLNNRLEKN